MCAECGTYRGREVVDIVAKKERTIARAKNKAKSRGLDIKEAGEKAKTETAPKSTGKTTKTKTIKK